MVELATIAMNTTYTGNEPWVAEIEKFDMIYLESNYGGSNHSVLTQIYSSDTFKNLLDKAISGDPVYILDFSRYVYIYNGYFSGSGISSLKIYGIKL